jgi:hypothetical protein
VDQRLTAWHYDVDMSRSRHHRFVYGVDWRVPVNAAIARRGTNAHVKADP